MWDRVDEEFDLITVVAELGVGIGGIWWNWWNLVGIGIGGFTPQPGSSASLLLLPLTKASSRRQASL